MLIFLDIDGVMVPAKSWQRPELLNDGFPAFSKKASHALKRLISDDTTVMLTTSHKSNYTVDEWRNIFSNRGIDVKEIESLGNNERNLSRKDEIVEWFASHDISEDFIIIDDDKSLNSLPPFLRKNSIITSPTIGLTDNDLKDASAILNKWYHFA
ncbi:HAD domain-containing protein [Dinghuibacter silviterrae]|nr:HAD domain-containing protein [Dinghuibacter silviterrae]